VFSVQSQRAYRAKFDWEKPLDDQTIRFDEFRLS
jgi:hypothetical protein